MLCLPGLPSARSHPPDHHHHHLLNLKTSQKEVKLARKLIPAFVTGASWALFGEGLALGAVRNDQRGLKRGSAGPPAKPIRGRPGLLSASKLTLGKLALKASVEDTIRGKGSPLSERRADQQWQQSD